MHGPLNVKVSKAYGAAIFRDSQVVVLRLLNPEYRGHMIVRNVDNHLLPDKA
jgi:hypothetical protein